MNYRRDTINAALLRELSDIILNKLKDPRIGFITVTDVKVSNDLSQAKIYISLMDGKDIDEHLSILKKASGFIRAELGGRIRLRHVPELTFHHDISIESGTRIDKILREI